MSKANMIFAAALVAGAAAGPVAAQSAGPVKIGILNDQSGAYSSTTGAGSVVAARLAIEDVGGQLFGKPIEVVVADHGHKPDIGSSIARRWFDVEGVGAIFDFYSSGVAPRMMCVLAQDFLQEHDIGRYRPHRFAQIVQHEAAVERGESLVGVHSQKRQRRHPLSSADRVPDGCGMRASRPCPAAATGRAPSAQPFFNNGHSLSGGGTNASSPGYFFTSVRMSSGDFICSGDLTNA